MSSIKRIVPKSNLNVTIQSKSGRTITDGDIYKVLVKIENQINDMAMNHVDDDLLGSVRIHIWPEEKE